MSNDQTFFIYQQKRKANRIDYLTTLSFICIYVLRLRLCNEGMQFNE
jgi:hypothetical protein